MGSDPAYVLHVELRVRPERRERFLAAIGDNAAASVREEPGCLRFDVVQDAGDPDHYFLYEVYRDEAAFQEHRSMPHFAQWRREAAECLVPGGQNNTGCRLLHSPSPAAPLATASGSAQPEPVR